MSESDDINSLRVKQKEMQSVISQQDEVIRKLDEEIQIIKVKLLSFENVISNSIRDRASP